MSAQPSFFAELERHKALLMSTPLLDPCRSDPRFAAQCARLHIDPGAATPRSPGHSP